MSFTQLWSKHLRVGWNAESCRSVTKQCLQYIKGLTISLQKRAKDICQAYNEVSSIVATLSEVRLTIDLKHKEWFDAAVALGQTALLHSFLGAVVDKQHGITHQVTHQRFTTS